MKIVDKFKKLRNDTQMILISLMIFLFILMIFIIITSVKDSNVKKEITYTFNKNTSISLNKSLSNNTKEYMYNTFICEYSEAYNKCDQIERFYVTKKECCKLGFCCDK